MPLYDPMGDQPPPIFDAPDLSMLQYPWDMPPAQPPGVAIDPAAQPPGGEAAPPLPLAPVTAIPPVDAALAGSPAFADAPPPIPPPDAVTGAGGMPPMGAIAPTGEPGVSYAALQTPSQQQDATAEQRAQTIRAYGDNPLAIPDEADRQGYLNYLAQNDPGKFAEVTIQHEDAKRREGDAARAKIQADDHRWQMGDLKRRQDADAKTRQDIDAVLADAKRISETKIDPSGGVHGIGRVAGVLQAIIGGLIQGKTGSANNMGLDALNATIARGIEAQKADLVNQREGIGHRNSTLQQELARHGDAFQAEEAVRIASLKYADDQLATAQQNFDPKGTTALRIAAARGGIAQQQQAGLATAQQKRFENNLKLAEIADKAAARDAAALQHRDDQALGWSRLGFDQAKDRRDAALKGQELDIRRGERTDARDLKRAETVRALSLGSPTPRLKLDAKGAPLVDEAGKPVVEAGAFRQANGEEFLAPDETTRKTLADKTLAASEVSDIINRILEIRDRVGGESGTFNSDEAQQLKVLQNRLVILEKSGTQGMSSDEDMKKIAAALGADDVSSFRARAAGLKEGLGRSSAELNKAYRIANYSGPRIEFANPYAAGPKNTAEDDAVQKLLQKPGVSFDDVAKGAIDRRLRDLSPDEQRDPASAAYAAAVRGGSEEARSTYHPDASPDQQRQIADLEAVAGSSGPDSMKARQTLQKVLDSAHTAKLRELADQALGRLRNADIGRSTSREP